MIAQEHVLALWGDCEEANFVDKEAYMAREWLFNSLKSWVVLVPWRWKEFGGLPWGALSVSDALHDCYGINDARFEGHNSFCVAGTGQRLQPYPMQSASDFKHRCLDSIKASIPSLLEPEARLGVYVRPEEGVSLVDYVPADASVYPSLAPRGLLPPWMSNCCPFVDHVTNETGAIVSSAPHLFWTISPRFSFIPPRITGFMPSILYQLKGENLLFLWDPRKSNRDLIRGWWSGQKARRGPPGLEWALRTLKGLKVVLLSEGDCVSIPGGSFWSMMTWADSLNIRVDYADRTEATISPVRDGWLWLEENAQAGLFREDEEDDGWSFGKTSKRWLSGLTEIFLDQRDMAVSLGLGDMYDGLRVKYAYSGGDIGT
jgi:hypothetical protein